MDKKRVHIDDLKKQTPFQVPQQYFETLDERIMKKTSEKLLKNFAKSNASIFRVPDAYFETQYHEITQKTSAQISLNDIPKHVIFSHPENYFSDLPLAIQTRLYNKKQNTVYGNILLKPVHVASSLAAACLIVYFYFFNPFYSKSHLQNISRNDIQQYFDLYLEVDQEIILELASLQNKLLVADAPQQPYEEIDIELIKDDI